MKLLIAGILLLGTLGAYAADIDLKNLAGRYEGSYGFWGSSCSVEIIVDGDEVDLMVDAKSRVEMNSMTLSLANSRVNAGEPLFKGNRNAGYQTEADLSISTSGKLTRVEAREYTTGFFGRKLDKKVYCNFK